MKKIESFFLIDEKTNTKIEIIKPENFDGCQISLLFNTDFPIMLSGSISIKTLKFVKESRDFLVNIYERDATGGKVKFEYHYKNDILSQYVDMEKVTWTSLYFEAGLIQLPFDTELEKELTIDNTYTSVEFPAYTPYPRLSEEINWGRRKINLFYDGVNGKWDILSELNTLQVVDNNLLGKIRANDGWMSPDPDNTEDQFALVWDVKNSRARRYFNVSLRVECKTTRQAHNSVDWQLVPTMIVFQVYKTMSYPTTDSVCDLQITGQQQNYLNYGYQAVNYGGNYFVAEDDFSTYPTDSNGDYPRKVECSIKVFLLQATHYPYDFDVYVDILSMRFFTPDFSRVTMPISVIPINQFPFFNRILGLGNYYISTPKFSNIGGSFKIKLKSLLTAFNLFLHQAVFCYPNNILLADIYDLKNIMQREIDGYDIEYINLDIKDNYEIKVKDTSYISSGDGNMLTIANDINPDAKAFLRAVVGASDSEDIYLLGDNFIRRAADYEPDEVITFVKLGKYLNSYILPENQNPPNRQMFKKYSIKFKVKDTGFIYDIFNNQFKLLKLNNMLILPTKQTVLTFPDTVEVEGLIFI